MSIDPRVMPEWVAAPEDALAFWFARETGHAIETVTVFDRSEETMRVAITWAERAQDRPGGDLTADVPWVSSADIGQKDVHLPSLFAALALHEDDLGDCERQDCSAPAAQFVLWSAAYWERAASPPAQAIQQFCERHVPSIVPFHGAQEATSPGTPGFGWRPGSQ